MATVFENFSASEVALTHLFYTVTMPFLIHWCGHLIVRRVKKKKRQKNIYLTVKYVDINCGKIKFIPDTMWSTRFPGSGRVGSVLFGHLYLWPYSFQKGQCLTISSANLPLYEPNSSIGLWVSKNVEEQTEPHVSVDTWFSVCRALLSQSHFDDHVPPFGGSWMEHVQWCKKNFQELYRFLD